MRMRKHYNTIIRSKEDGNKRQPTQYEVMDQMFSNEIIHVSYHFEVHKVSGKTARVVRQELLCLRPCVATR